MISVVIPAHNEAATIGRCLDALTQQAAPNELEVIVVCNGCSDDTADRARGHASRPQVLETPVGSKTHALNLGDQAASGHPRVYVDADVRVTTGDLRRLVANLDGGVEVVAPTPRYQVEGAPWVVRAYLRVWERLPAVTGALTGAGVFALTKSGRARFGAFPAVIADDRFLQEQFLPGERRRVPNSHSVVESPRSVASLVSRKRRVVVGNAELRRGQGGGDAGGTDWLGCLRVVRDDWRRLIDLPAFVIVSVLARLPRRGGNDVAWGQDLSSRPTLPARAVGVSAGRDRGSDG